PLDLRPGDDARLRTIRAVFRRDGEAGKLSGAILDREMRSSSSGSSLGALLEAPHGMAMLLLLAALFGAAHALTPGHGKTMVAAYLIGERGTARHAVVLGLVTTITHT